jgi:hypothetical protein
MCLIFLVRHSMEITVQSTVVAILTSSLISSSVTYLVFKKNYMFNELRILNDNYMQIKSFAIQYPYLESQDFIKKYKSHEINPDEQKIRYGIYCSFIFNTLQRICIYFKYDKIKIRQFIHIQEIVSQHQNWWKNPSGMYQNKEGYEDEFKSMVNYLLN